nr:hypothetical protein B0A51_06236 [Rachicladosporium sp. CCFEE 5018]
MSSVLPHTTNDENTSTYGTPLQHGSTPNRRVLGDVSANAKVHAAGLVGSKPMTGSPLKRSFTAAIEGGQGFTYLKKRKSSGDGVLSSVQVNVEGGDARLRLHGKPVLEYPPYVEIDLASPTEPNTPSDSGGDSQDSNDRKSFSSLINYDPSSQPGGSSSQQDQQMSKLLFKSISHAEMLQLRLRVAMYKIKTNQVHVPFAQLKVNGQVPLGKSNTGVAVEAAVASLRREAQASMHLHPPAPMIPKLLPGPVLLPTAYSSRKIYDLPRASMSPITSPLKSGQQSEITTPKSIAGRVVRAESADLTSSVVKGRVAESLVGLSQGHARSLQWVER